VRTEPNTAKTEVHWVRPGVYVGESSSAEKPIEGVSTVTAGFVGPTLSGPVDQAVGPIASFPEFERNFGEGVEPVHPMLLPDYLWHAVRSFFLEGGTRLWVARVAGAIAGIYAHTDMERGVHATPANREVRTAARLEVNLTDPQAKALNTVGVDCLRRVAGRTGSGLGRADIEH
jgi:phage tail sheath protein FI